MIRGFVDRLRIYAPTEGRIVGWACDTSEPSHRLQVRGRIEGRVLGLAVADRERPDLFSRGIGDGHSGFVVLLENQLTVAEQELLRVETKRQDGGDWTELPWRQVNGRRDVARHAQEEAASALWSENGTPMDRATQRPVFVTGSARSGTSAIYQGLTLVTRYRGFFEGHVLDVGATMARVVEEHIRAKLNEIPNPQFYHLTAINPAVTSAAVHEMLGRLASGYMMPYWADKTPTPQMVSSLPVLASTWPAARVIFMKRRGIENMMSRLRKFPEATFEHGAEDWVAAMSAWRAVRTNIPGRFLELEQLELLRAPHACARAVGVLLALNEDEIKALTEYLRQNRPEMTDPTAQIVKKIEDTGWSPEQIDTFRRMCHGEMTAYGYTYDERYSEPLVEPRNPIASAGGT